MEKEISKNHHEKRNFSLFNFSELIRAIQLNAHEAKISWHRTELVQTVCHTILV